MQVPLDITYLGIPRSEVLEGSVREEAEKLGSSQPLMRSCRVTLEDRPPHAYECRRFHVRLDLGLHRGEVVVNREHDQDIGAALREAFDAAQRQLIE